jgi:hypothetical protein
VKEFFVSDGGRLDELHASRWSRCCYERGNPHPKDVDEMVLTDVFPVGAASGAQAKSLRQPRGEFGRASKGL